MYLQRNGAKCRVLTKINESENVGHSDLISISMGSTHQDILTYED